MHVLQNVAESTSNATAWFSILTLMLGWALGLFSQPLSERLHRPKQVRELKAAVFAEMRDLGFVLALAAVKVAYRRGFINEEIVAKTRRVIDHYEGVEEEPGSLHATRTMLATPLGQLQAESRAQVTPGGALRVIPYRLPFFDSQIPRFHILPLELQQRLHKFRGQLELFNGDVQFAMSLFQQTFDSSLSADNHASITAMLDESYRRVARRAADIADDIDAIVTRYGN